MLANIDHISCGSSAWNVVTSVSDGEARNYRREKHFSHGERCERASEFTDVVQKLSDSWGADTFGLDSVDAYRWAKDTIRASQQEHACLPEMPDTELLFCVTLDD